MKKSLGGLIRMNLWGAGPLIAAAMLSGAGGTHAAAAGHAIHDGRAGWPQIRSVPRSAPPTGQGSSTPSASPSPTVASVSQPGPSPGLVETAPGRWVTTFPVYSTSSSCPGPVTSYWLQTSSPNRLIPGRRAAELITQPPASPAPKGVVPGSACEVTVRFSGLDKVPVSAVLAIDQAGSSTSLQLTVNRTVTLFYYLGIPLIAGGALALAMILASLLRVRLYRPDLDRLRPWERAYWGKRLSASGAWSVSDSWATNISGTLVIIGSVIAALPVSAAAFFPGVTLDRFIPVNLAVGAILAGAPLVFGVLYTWWTARVAAATVDATLTLPASIQAILASPADTALERNTTLYVGGAEKRLDQAVTARLGKGAVAVPRTSRIHLAADTVVTLPAGTDVIAFPAGGAARWRVLGWGIRRWFRDTPVSAISLPRGVRATLEPVNVRLLAGQPPAFAGPASIWLPRWTRIRPPGGPVVLLLRSARVGLSPDAEGRVLTSTLRSVLAQETWVTFPGPVVLAGGTTATVALRAARDAGLVGAGRGLQDRLTIALPHGTTAELPDRVRARFEVAPEISEMIFVPSGATITVAGDATVTWTDNGVTMTRKVQFGKGIQVPPGSRMTVTPADMGTQASLVIPNTTDLAVSAASTLRISGGSGALVLAEGDLLPADQAAPGSPPAGAAHHHPAGKPAASADAAKAARVVRYPVDISTENGAKISVVGTADVTLPRGTVITTPGRPAARPLPRDVHLQAPQGGSTLVGTVAIVLAAAVVTMFGIGMEVGLACVLTFGLSAASQFWRWMMLAGSILIGLFVLWYAVAAVQALADPRPGSALSATGGTSFTL